MNNTRKQNLADKIFLYIVLAGWSLAMFGLFSAFCGFVERNGIHPSLFGIHDEVMSVIVGEGNL